MSHEFQSTHPRGVRQNVIKMIGLYGYFNPRTHVGCDEIQADRHCSPRISIHAPTWGATIPIADNKHIQKFQSTHPRGVRRVFRCHRFYNWYFNPRTHVGCDGLYAHLFGLVFISIHAPTWGATRNGKSNKHNNTFQSTHPRGVRLLSHQMVGF